MHVWCSRMAGFLLTPAVLRCATSFGPVAALGFRFTGIINHGVYHPIVPYLADNERLADGITSGFNPTGFPIHLMTVDSSWGNEAMAFELQQDGNNKLAGSQYGSDSAAKAAMERCAMRSQTATPPWRASTRL